MAVPYGHLQSIPIGFQSPDPNPSQQVHRLVRYNLHIANFLAPLQTSKLVLEARLSRHIR